jgi:hypothetical protein
MSYLIEFLVLLVVALVVALVALVLWVMHSRSTVRSWQAPGKAPVLAGKAEAADVAGECCFAVPCSADCARKQQTMHTATYLSGMQDMLQHPNRVRELIQAGEELAGDDGRLPPEESGW